MRARLNASNAPGLASPMRDALRACGVQFGYVILFSAAVNLLYLAPSIFMLQVYDRVVTSRSVSTLLFLGIVLVASLATLSFLDAMRGRILIAVSGRLGRLISPRLIEAAGKQTQLIREFDGLRASITGPPALALIDAPWTPIYLAACFLIHPWTGMLATAGGVLLLVVAVANERATRIALRTTEDSTADSYAVLTGDSAHADTARALGMRGVLLNRQLAARAVAARSAYASGRIGAGFLSGVKFTRLVLQSAMLALGAYLAINQDITAGGIIAGSILATRAFAPIEQIVGAWKQLGQSIRAFGKIDAVLNAIDARSRTYTELPAPRGSLAVERVIVRAGDALILQNINFQAEPGEIIGVIGPSGAGKTTLMRVVSGAVSADAGIVRLDGAKASDWNPDRLGRHIGYLPQDVGFFSGTVTQNISRFQIESDRTEIDRAVIAAARAAGVHDLVLSLPKGYDTDLGPKGRALSAGQAQRLALARALYKEPVLLVLDEPNAHLDADGEAALIAAIKNASARGALSIVAAHRAGLVNIAHKLLVLRDGKIEVFGPREQIAARLTQSPKPLTAANESGAQR